MHRCDLCQRQCSFDTRAPQPPIPVMSPGRGSLEGEGVLRHPRHSSPAVFTCILPSTICWSDLFMSNPPPTHTHTTPPRPPLTIATSWLVPSLGTLRQFQFWFFKGKSGGWWWDKRCSTCGNTWFDATEISTSLIFFCKFNRRLARIHRYNCWENVPNCRTNVQMSHLQFPLRPFVFWKISFFLYQERRKTPVYFENTLSSLSSITISPWYSAAPPGDHPVVPFVFKCLFVFFAELFAS